MTGQFQNIKRLAHDTSVEQEIRDEIQAKGPLPFSRFMEMALFSPKGGYYSTTKKIGQYGDYYTSPTSHPLFAKLLSIQIQQMWVCLDRPSHFYVIEPGGGTGLLYDDLAASFTSMSQDFQDSIIHIPLDRRRPTTAPPVWIQSSGLPFTNLVGCVISNELFDSFPVHQFQVQKNSILEIYVDYRDGHLVELPDYPSHGLLELLSLYPLVYDLPEGFRGEISTGIEEWFLEASQALDQGFVLTIDYGGWSEDIFSNQRNKGTIQCYYEHTVNSNPLIRVGSQDITAHVNFTRLSEAGRRYGFTDLGYSTQQEFLVNLGARAYLKALSSRAQIAASQTLSRSSPSSSPPQIDQHAYLTNRMGIETLLREDGLGGFKVLCQGIRTGKPALWGFQENNEQHTQAHADFRSLDMPLKKAQHIPLLEGNYPHVISGLDINPDGYTEPY